MGRGGTEIADAVDTRGPAEALVRSKRDSVAKQRRASTAGSDPFAEMFKLWQQGELDPAVAAQFEGALRAHRIAEENPVRVATSHSDDPLFAQRALANRLASESNLLALGNNELMSGTRFEDKLVAAINDGAVEGLYRGWKDEFDYNDGADIYVLSHKPSEALAERLERGLFWRGGEPFTREAGEERPLPKKLREELSRKAQRLSLKTDHSSLRKPDRFDFELLHQHPFGSPVKTDREGEPRVDRKRAREIVGQMLEHIDRYERMIVGRMLPTHSAAAEMPDQEPSERSVDLRYDLCEVHKQDLLENLRLLDEALATRKSLETIERETNFRFTINKQSLVVTVVHPEEENIRGDELPVLGFALSRKASVLCHQDAATTHQSFAHRPPPAHEMNLLEALHHNEKQGVRRRKRLAGENPGKGSWNGWTRARLPHETEGEGRLQVSALDRPMMTS